MLQYWEKEGVVLIVRFISVIPPVLTVLTVLLFVVQYFKQDTQCMYKSNIEAHSCHLCCRGKTMSVTHSEFVSVALIIELAMRKSRVTLSSVDSLTVPYFLIIS